MAAGAAIAYVVPVFTGAPPSVQLIVPLRLGVAERLALLPSQIVWSVTLGAGGTGFTITATGVRALVQPFTVCCT